jgi:hypothetical protein
MTKLEFSTYIKAPASRCFDLARSVDFHKISAKQIKEESVGGFTTGLISFNQHVLLESRLLGMRVFTELKITKFNPPFFFSYEMTNRILTHVIHDYYFYDIQEETVMVNKYYFKTSFGLLGELINWVYLKNYLIRLISTRNALLAEYAETEKWKDVLPLVAEEKTIVC